MRAARGTWCHFPVPPTLSSLCSPDVDECTEGSHACRYNQLCQNAAGSYSCSCPPGYRTLGTGWPCLGTSWALRVCGHPPALFQPQVPPPSCSSPPLSSPRCQRVPEFPPAVCLRVPQPAGLLRVPVPRWQGRAAGRAVWHSRDGGRGHSGAPGHSPAPAGAEQPPTGMGTILLHPARPAPRGQGCRDGCPGPPVPHRLHQEEWHLHR